MANFPSQPLRALSPITELTTPASLRVLRLPLDEADYEPERARHRRTVSGDDDGGGSVYSNHSGDTVKQDRPTVSDSSSSPTALEQRSAVPLSVSPLRPPKRPKPSPLPLDHSALLLETSPLTLNSPRSHHSTPPPGGLPPPPRSGSFTKQGALRHSTPPPSPRHNDSVVVNKTSEESARPQSSEQQSPSLAHPGIAGVGAGGRSIPNSIRCRPNSFHAASRLNSPTKLSPREHVAVEFPTRPVLITQHSHPTLHNIPFFPLESGSSPRMDSKTPPRSRPNSLKKRPKTYHGSTQSSIRSRPNSIHGELPRGSTSPVVMPPAMDLAPVVSPIHIRHNEASNAPAALSDSSLSPPAATRPQLVTHRSETSLPSRSPSTKSLTSRRKSQNRRHRVSSILSSIFGSNHNSDSSQNRAEVGRKLSRRSRQTSGSSATGMASRGSSQEPSPIFSASIGAVSPAEELHMSLPTAIRTSGTFGIRDDGSEINPHALGRPSFGSHSSAAALNRTQSGDGSVDTQAEGTKRILFVQNGHDNDLPEEDEPPQDEHNVLSPIPSLVWRPVTVETIPDVDEPGISGTPSRLRGYAQGRIVEHVPRGNSPHPNQSRAPAGTLLAARSSPRASTGSDYYGLGLLFAPQSAPSAPSPTEAYQSPSIRLSSQQLSNSFQNGLIDKATQTSAMLSPTKSPHGRPLPRLPSRQASPGIRTPEPTFVAPPPPELAPAPDLPLLIASHLLSTHAAALMRHSTAMRGASETMQKMARESLDWGGVLMGMANRTPEQLTQAQQASRTYTHDEMVYEGVALRHREDRQVENAGSIGTTAYQTPFQQPAAYSIPLTLPHPVQAAYDNLTSIPPRPSAVRRASRVSLEQARGESLPADLVKEAQRLGQEGWASLRAAEDAWSQAMTSLAEIVEPKHSNTQSDEETTRVHHTPSATDSGHGDGVASTSPVLRDSVISANAALDLGLDPPLSNTTSAYTFSPATANLVRSGTPLYFDSLAAARAPTPSRLLRPIPVQDGMSFLPLEADMITSPTSIAYPPPSLAPEGSDEMNQETVRARPRGPHAYSNPLVRPVESPVPEKHSPLSYLPSNDQPAVLGGSTGLQRGYTDGQLGSTRRSSGPGLGREESSLTVSSITKSASGTRRKLAKGKKGTGRHTSAWRNNDISMSGDERQRMSTKDRSKGTGDQLDSSTSTKGTAGSRGKKHWWSRR